MSKQKKTTSEQVDIEKTQIQPQNEVVNVTGEVEAETKQNTTNEIVIDVVEDDLTAAKAESDSEKEDNPFSTGHKDSMSETEQRYQRKLERRRAKREAYLAENESKRQKIKAQMSEEVNGFKRFLLRLKLVFVFIIGKIHQNIGGFCRKYFIDAFSGMALGLFATLIIGTIIEQIGKLCGEQTPVGITLIGIGTAAKLLTGAGIGVGIAHSLKVPKLVMFSAAVSGFLGGNILGILNGTFMSGTGVYIIKGFGDPVTAYVAVVISIEISKLFVGKTKIDIIAIPILTIGISAGIALLLGPAFNWLFTKIGDGINLATELQPIPMGMIVGASMGILLTLPTSSAAIGIMLKLNGIAAGAAAVGCACHMIGFAVASFRENKWGGLVAQGVGTSMLQIPNLMRNFKIMIPAIVASLICSPIASAGFGLTCNFVGSGMGTSGFVGCIQMIAESTKIMSTGIAWTGMLLTMFVLPAVIAFFTSEILRKIGWIRKDDMKLEL